MAWVMQVLLPDDPEPYYVKAKNQAQLSEWEEAIWKMWPDARIQYGRF